MDRSTRRAGPDRGCVDRWDAFPLNTNGREREVFGGAWRLGTRRRTRRKPCQRGCPYIYWKPSRCKSGLGPSTQVKMPFNLQTAPRLHALFGPHVITGPLGDWQSPTHQEVEAVTWHMLLDGVMSEYVDGMSWQEWDRTERAWQHWLVCRLRRHGATRQQAWNEVMKLTSEIHFRMSVKAHVESRGANYTPAVPHPCGATRAKARSSAACVASKGAAVGR